MAYTPAAGGSHENIHAHAGDQPHHLPAIVYYKTFGWLMLLLFATVGAYYIDLEKIFHIRGLNLLVAMGIAIPKATLVVLFFMNVKYSTRLTWLWAGLGFLWLLLMAGVFLDYQSRAWQEPLGWQQTPYTHQ
jgi:cytochrome c oxidase subunit 4